LKLANTKSSGLLYGVSACHAFSTSANAGCIGTVDFEACALVPEAIWQANAALAQAAYGNTTEARRSAAEAQKLAPTSQGSEVEAALAFAMSGETARAESLVQDLDRPDHLALPHHRETRGHGRGVQG
jgi:hypothetical protein